MVSAPNKYPAIEENTTLNDKRIFVISLKSEIAECLIADAVVLKIEA